jgi:hypothetical protein
MARSPDMRTELAAFASSRPRSISCLSGLSCPVREHLPGRAAGQGRAGACSLRPGTTRARLGQTMSIRRLPHAAQRQRSCTSGVSPRPAARETCEVGVALVFATPAGQQHADIATTQRGPGIGHGDSIERAVERPALHWRSPGSLLCCQQEVTGHADQANHLLGRPSHQRCTGGGVLGGAEAYCGQPPKDVDHSGGRGRRPAP